MEHISHKMTLEITNTVIIAAVVFFVVGYLVGNVAPVPGSVGTAAKVQQIGEQPAAAGGAAQQQQQQPSQRVSLEPEDDPALGNKDAKVIVYEFSDFQCSFCQRFFQQSFGQLEQEYINTGKVLFVYKDFPLTQIHPAAGLAAIYAKCANDQGKWKKFHDAVFNNQAQLSLGQSGLDQIAQTAGLDASALQKCAADPASQAEVEQDISTGVAVGVTGTPSFFIGSPEKGFVNVVGAQPYSVIKQVIDQKLAE